MSSDTPLTPEQRAALANTFGFMRELCDAASEGLSGLQAQAAPESSDEDTHDLSAERIIIVKCKPLDLPQPPPTSSGDGCYLPEGIRSRFEGVAGVEGLGMLFEHLNSICREILTAYGNLDAEAS